MDPTSSSTLLDPVVGYADRLHRALPGGHRVTSPLGAWIVLALAAPAAEGPTRDELAQILGLPVADAAAAAAALLADPHPAVAAAAAAWVREAARTPALDTWLADLPAAVEHGDVPPQAGADAWARDHTLGLIEQFPLQLGADTLLVLCSALATRVSWDMPFELGDPFGAWSGPTLSAERGGRIVTTPIGDVGVYTAGTTEGLSVTSVIAAPDVADVAVLDVAHRIATGAHGWPDRSLFDLPLGDSGWWSVTELDGVGGRERVSARLPAWEATSTHQLLADDRTGFPAAARAVKDLLAADAVADARQVAVARYSRVGFEAAAVTVMAMVASARVERPGRERVAVIRFGHPHAVVAIAHTPMPTSSSAGWAVHPWDRLPVFATWVAEAVDAVA